MNEITAFVLNENGTPIKNVRTPFKTCLFWSKSQSEEKKRKQKEKLPAVASSEKWKQFQQKKEEMKDKQEIPKQERKLQREAKQKIIKFKC